MDAIRADTIRCFGRYSARKLIWGLIRYRCFRVVITHRLAKKNPLFAALHHFAQWVAVVELPKRARIGPGFKLTHGFGVVISKGAEIGANCTLLHGVTLGQADGSRGTRYPVLEDEVWVGPNAAILGARVGQGSRILAGAIVTRDIPPHSVVQGNPAIIVKSDCAPDVRNAA